MNPYRQDPGLGRILGVHRASWLGYLAGALFLVGLAALLAYVGLRTGKRFSMSSTGQLKYLIGAGGLAYVALVLGRMGWQLRQLLFGVHVDGVRLISSTSVISLRWSDVASIEEHHFRAVTRMGSPGTTTLTGVVLVSSLGERLELPRELRQLDQILAKIGACTTAPRVMVVTEARAGS